MKKKFRSNNYIISECLFKAMKSDLKRMEEKIEENDRPGTPKMSMPDYLYMCGKVSQLSEIINAIEVMN